jgi:DNA-binding NarL/FixJ family response regulator
MRMTITSGVYATTRWFPTNPGRNVLDLPGPEQGQQCVENHIPQPAYACYRTPRLPALQRRKDEMEPLRVGILEEDEVLRRGVVAILGEEDCECIVLGGERDMSPEAADAEASLDVAVVCSRALSDVRFTCPVVLLATPELAGEQRRHAASNVMATLPHEGLTAKQLVASVRAAAAGLQVAAANLGSPDGKALDPRRIEVLKLLATGANTRTIARRLQLSERTVKTLVHDIQLSLGTTTRAQAVAEAVRLGLI